MTDNLLSQRLAQAFKAACMAEIEALKPGNVHIFADGHGMVVQDFIKSAEVASAVIAKPGLTVGERILAAVEATQHTVHCNTNLGIILLAAPLIHAALASHKPLFPLRRESSLVENSLDYRLGGNDENGLGEYGENGLVQTFFRERLAQVLCELTVEDARLAYQAIRQANPAGLGESASYDVHSEPEVTLLEAMREAELRDRIAFQYTHGFVDIFDFGVKRYAETMHRWKRPAWATTAVYLGFLARFDDSHVVRKFGLVVAQDLREEAKQHEQALLVLDNPKQYQRELLKFDAELKTRDLNPGTSADLTVASLLVADLQARLSN